MQNRNSLGIGPQLPPFLLDQPRQSAQCYLLRFLNHNQKAHRLAVRGVDRAPIAIIPVTISDQRAQKRRGGGLGLVAREDFHRKP